MNILERYRKPTPRFFRILRNIGLAIAASGGAVLAVPMALPVMLVAIAAYATVIGTVMSSISQAVVADCDDTKEPLKEKDHEL